MKEEILFGEQYEELSKTYKNFDNFQTKSVQRAIRDYTAVKESILDVGCADGYLTELFTRSNYVAGIDCNDYLRYECLRIGFDEHVIQDLNKPWTCFDADRKFDTIFCGQTIEHIADTDLLLCEFNRHLRLGGHLIITTPNVRTIQSLCRMALNKTPAFGARYRSGHLRDFTTSSLRKAVENNGFSVVETKGVEFWSPIFQESLSAMFSYLPSLSTAFMMVCRKQLTVEYKGTQFEY